MIGIINQAGILVQKDRPCFVKRNPVLDQVGPRLAPVPGKFDIAQDIMLAIRQHRTYDSGQLRPRFVSMRGPMSSQPLEEDAIPAEVDFSKGVRGLHHIPRDAKVFLPASIERSVWQ